MMNSTARFTRIRIAVMLGLLCSLSAAQPSSADDAANKQGEVQRKLLKTFHDEFVRITPGKGKFPAAFEMGSTKGNPNELPVHRVTLRGAFWIAKYEVPQNLYEAVMEINPSRWKGPRNSVEMMTRKEATEFCEKITQLMRNEKLLGSDELIRLPTEAEWEYCCRAGTQSQYSFGDSAVAAGDADKQASVLSEYGWHTGNAKGNDPPVGAKKPNAWGLYDMHGYLWEFVGDDWHDDYRGAPANGDRWAAKTGKRVQKRTIVLRSGSWKDRFEKLRSAYRKQVSASVKDDAVGFRCVKARVSPK